MPITILCLLHEQSHPIPTIPSPTAGNYSHMDGGIMDGWWIGVGDDDGDDLLQFPVPAGCQNRDFWSRFEVSGWRRSYGTPSGKLSNPPMFLGQRPYVARRRGQGGAQVGHTPPGAARGRPAPGMGVGPLWPSSSSPSGSVGLRVK